MRRIAIYPSYFRSHPDPDRRTVNEKLKRLIALV